MEEAVEKGAIEEDGKDEGEKKGQDVGDAAGEVVEEGDDREAEDGEDEVGRLVFYSDVFFDVKVPIDGHDEESNGG